MENKDVQSEVKNETNASVEEQVTEEVKTEQTEDDNVTDINSKLEEKKVDDQIKDLQSKVEASEDKYKRLQAEYSNYIRRTQQEKETIGVFANFYAIGKLYIADASMLNKLSPFFAILFSYLLLKEKIKPYQMICVITAFIGALFILRPGFDNVATFPAFVGMIGGMGEHRLHRLSG